MCFAPVAFPPEVFFSDVQIPTKTPAQAEAIVCGDCGDGVISFMELLIAAAGRGRQTGGTHNRGGAGCQEL